MSYVFILQHYLRLLAACCNLTNHLKQMPYRDEYTLQALNSPRMSVTSMMEVVWSTKFHGKLGRLMSHFVEGILSIQRRNMTNQSFFLFDGYLGGPSTKGNSHLRWKKSSGSNSPHWKEATKVHCLIRISFRSKWTNWGTFFVGWWNGDTYWDWLEACWVFNGGSPLQLQD